MAKVTGQNIPPAYFTMAGRVLTKKRRNGTTVTHTTNRKAAKKSTKIKPEPDGMNDFSAAACSIHLLCRRGLKNNPITIRIFGRMEHQNIQ
jgi:hypothetical protein